MASSKALSWLLVEHRVPLNDDDAASGWLIRCGSRSASIRDQRRLLRWNFHLLLSAHSSSSSSDSVTCYTEFKAHMILMQSESAALKLIQNVKLTSKGLP